MSGRASSGVKPDRLRDAFAAMLGTVKDAGIDDVPKLTGFFYLLGLNRMSNTILPEFYQTQIREWCPITRQAQGKLKIAWIDDAAFRQKYQGSPWFLEMLAKLVGDGSSAKGDCL